MIAFLIPLSIKYHFEFLTISFRKFLLNPVNLYITKTFDRTSRYRSTVFFDIDKREPNSCSDTSLPT